MPIPLVTPAANSRVHMSANMIHSPHLRPNLSGLWRQASRQGTSLSQAAKAQLPHQHKVQHRCRCRATAQQIATADNEASSRQSQLSLDLDTATAAEQSSMDNIAQIMAAKLEQQARLMPPDLDQSPAADADALDWDNVAPADATHEAESSASKEASQPGKTSGRRAINRKGGKPRTKEIPVQDLPKVAIMEGEESNIHMRNLSIHRTNNEEEALNLVR